RVTRQITRRLRMSTVEQQSVDISRNGGGDGRTFAVDNPATGETIAHLPDMDAEQVGGLVERGRAAQKAWGEASFDDRAAVMYRARKWMTDNRERIAKTVMDETGKTQEDAFLADVFTTADALGFWAKKGPSYLADERVRTHSVMALGRKLILRYRPYGVVGVIGPWNYPIANCFGDAVPALMAGNSVILKPSEVTPLSSLLMLEGMRAAGLPDHVMQVATGTGETGAALVDGADMIMFTGSTRTGKKIMARAAETLTPVSLELGGKDPMIVLRDADLERAMEIMTEETFGPTLPIMKVRDADEAVRLANDTPYGLNSSVFAGDPDEGERIARKLTAGSACVNDAVINYAATELEFGGANQSGIGVRHGPGGIQKYCQVQALAVTRFAQKRELYHF